MIHHVDYVKRLLEKQRLQTLTAREMAELKAAKRIYSDQEWDDMVLEVLSSMDEPAAPLKPDVGRLWAIRLKGDQWRRAKKQQRKRRVYVVSAAMLVVVLGVLGVLTVRYRAEQKARKIHFVYGPCGQLPVQAEVPLIESSMALHLAQQERMVLGPSDRGEVMEEQGLKLVKGADGILRLSDEDPTRRRDKAATFTISTGAEQQCVVELPHGARIRMNALSALTIDYGMDDDRLEAQLTVQGEVAMQMGHSDGIKPIGIRTNNSSVEVIRGELALLTTKGYTRVVLRQGEVRVFQPDGTDFVTLRDDQQITLIGGPGAQGRGPLQHTDKENFAAATQWTKAVRVYENASLRAYVEEMGRWTGVQIKDLHCIPVDKRISRVVCYRSGMREFLASLREVGVPLSLSKGVLSFCPEGEEVQQQSVGRLAWWE